MKTTPFLLYLCALLLLADPVDAQLLSEPQLASKFQLPNATFKRGNALINYLGSVVATTAEGSLVRIRPSDQTILFSFTPNVVADRVLISSSGIAVFRDNFAIYSVVDAATDDTETTSRVLCVNLDDGTLVWTTYVTGRVVGTPQISEDLVYIVHNTDEGAITVFRMKDREEPSTVGSFNAKDTTLGPASLITVETQDFLAVASNRDNGFSEEGGLYMLIEQQTQNDGGQNGPGEQQGGGGGGKEDQSTGFSFVQVSTFPRSSVTAPLLNTNMELVLGQQGASLTAWVDDDLTDVLVEGFADNDLSPRWQRFVDENPEDGNAPILSTPIFSATGELVYVASAGPQFTAVILQEGRSAWSVDTEVPVTASPVLGDDVVYAIEANGRVSQYDALAGDVKWVLGCEVAETCDSGVEADFVIAESGNVMYFGDTTGNIVSIKVGSYPTEAPSSSPNLQFSEVPTKAPVEQAETLPPAPTIYSQTQSPSRTDATDAPIAESAITESPTMDTGSINPGEIDQQNPNNDNKNTMSYLVAGVLIVGAFILAFAACFVCRRNALSKKDVRSEQKAQQLAYEQACRNAEKEALEEIMKDRLNEEAMEQSGTGSFFYYADQSMATPASVSGTIQKNLGRDNDDDSEVEIGFEVGMGNREVSPVFGRPVASPEKLNSTSKNQHSDKSPALRTHFAPINLAPSSDNKDGNYDDEEPGRIVFREKSDAKAKGSQRPPSPAYSDIMSDDESLYTTDGPKPMIARSLSKDSSYPDDESLRAPGFPGMSSYFRSSSKKPTSPESAPVTKETSSPEVNVARTLAHAGVSVRQVSSKSRAGLFSRRNNAAISRPSSSHDIEAEISTPEASLLSNQPSSPVQPMLKETYQELKPEHVPISQSVPPPQEDEKTTQSQSTSNDVWNSFLSELSKAEESFFGFSKKKPRSSSPPPPPPPPDRTDSPPPSPHRNYQVPQADDGQLGEIVGTSFSKGEELDAKELPAPTKAKAKANGYFWV